MFPMTAATIIVFIVTHFSTPLGFRVLTTHRRQRTVVAIFAAIDNLLHRAITAFVGDLRAASLQVCKFGRTFVGRLTVIKQVFHAVIGVEIFQGVVDLSVEFDEQLFDFVGCPCFVAIGIGKDSRAVDAQFRKSCQTHVDGCFDHLPLDAFELLTVLPAKFAERGVIDAAARGEPHEIDGVVGVVCDGSRTANPPCHGKQQDFAEDRRMNGRLAFSALVGVVPFGLVAPVKDLVEHPDGMVVWNSLDNAGLKEDDLFFLHWRRLPVTGVDIFLDILFCSSPRRRFAADSMHLNYVVGIYLSRF